MVPESGGRLLKMVNTNMATVDRSEVGLFTVEVNCSLWPKSCPCIYQVTWHALITSTILMMMNR